jgi:hypothetical protein
VARRRPVGAELLALVGNRKGKMSFYGLLNSDELVGNDKYLLTEGLHH